ncbi:MAG TPA: thioredoxin domain-containing protein [Candidatus Paceibacterota bacterium]|nr:thioredoxin domain-containing protein [Verrucomicrobiota bacterium]HRY50262.1 thioredoxin domain-containing protein [Candidatus Paceibacterota bacterium]
MSDNRDQTTTLEVTAKNFDAEVLQATQPVVVTFRAPWSRPCHILDSALDEVAAACAGEIKMVKVNADDNPDLSLWYEIQSVPTLLLFVRGNLRVRMIGTASKEAILAKIQPALREADASLPPSDPNRNP